MCCPQGVYAPSEIDNNLVIQYEDRIVNTTRVIYRDMNSTLYSFRAASNDSALTRLPIQDWTNLNKCGPLPTASPSSAQLHLLARVCEICVGMRVPEGVSLRPAGPLQRPTPL